MSLGPYEIYRKASVGMALMDTLDELIQSGQITPHVALKTLDHFDRSVSTIFAAQLKARASAKSQLKTYRSCEEVWTFVLKNANFKVEGESIGPVEKVKVVACRGTAAPEGREAKKQKKEES